MIRSDVLIGAIVGGVLTLALLQSVHTPAPSSAPGDNAADVAAAAIAAPIL